MITVAGSAVAGDLRVYPCASCLCVLIRFENENARTFTDDETVSVLIERSGSCLGIFVCG